MYSVLGEGFMVLLILFIDFSVYIYGKCSVYICKYVGVLYVCKILLFSF